MTKAPWSAFEPTSNGPEESFNLELLGGNWHSKFCLNQVKIIRGFDEERFIAQRDALFPLVDKDAFVWDGTPTKAKQAVKTLFGPATKGCISDEKSLGYFWKKVAPPAPAKEDGSTSVTDDDVGLEQKALDEPADEEQKVLDEPVDEELKLLDEPVEEELKIQELPVEEETAIANIKQRPPKRSASQVAEASFSELYLVENEGVQEGLPEAEGRCPEDF